MREAVNRVGAMSYRNVLAAPPNFLAMIEGQLVILSGLTEDYKYEVGILIKHIRADFINSECDLGRFFFFLDRINSTYVVMNNIVYGNILFNFACIADYIRHLARYAPIYNKSLDAEYFANLIDEIQLESAKIIIDEQWKEVYSSSDGYKCFFDIWDDIFTNCIEKYEDKFFHSLSENDIICRSVEEDNICLANTAGRYIPWKNAGHTNRWNPPGVTFLYLSYDDKIRTYNSKINLSEYICLLETRSNADENHSFCYFKPTTGGKILDLSYNDMSLRNAKKILTEYQDNLSQKLIDELLATEGAKEKYQKAKTLKAVIKKKLEANPIDDKYIRESFAKQYLIMICSCIYKKVDETDDDKLDMAYKSFRILAKYLQSKGVTGIIYPCTRTRTVISKNLVLFDLNDAVPVESTIKHIKCSKETFEKE